MADGLVGREAETAHLVTRLERARGGEGGVVLLCGPAGIGKTSLVAALAEHARAEGVSVVSGRALDGDEVPPFWPWRGVLGTPDFEPDPALPASAEDAAARRFVAVQRLADRVVDVPAPGRLLVLEDAHWADAGSLALLRAVAARLDGPRLLVLVTHRDLPLGDASPLAGALPGLHAEPTVTSLRVRPLDRAAVGTLLERAAPAGDEVADAVARHTGGNALFVRTVAGLLAALPAPDRTPEAVAGLAARPELRDVVRAWTSALPERSREVLRTASVLGEDVAPDDLAALRDEDAREVLRALDAAAGAGAVVEDRAHGHYRFSHALVREAMYADLSAVDRARWHRAAAQRLEERPDPTGERAGELATHWLRGAASGSDLQRGASWAGRAGRTAARQDAWEDAARLLGSAAAAAERGGAQAGEVAELLLEAAEADVRAGALTSALTSSQRAADFAQAGARPDLLPATALAVQGIGLPPVNATLLALVDRALPVAEVPSVRARLLAQQACCLVHLDRTAAARAPSLQALELAIGSGDPLAELDAVRARHLVQARPEAVLERAALAERAGVLADVLAQPSARMWALLWQIDAAFSTPHLPTVDARLSELDALTRTTGLPVGRWHWHRLHAARAAVVGDFVGARRRCAEALSVARRLEDPEMIGLATAFLILLATLRGDPAELPGDLEEAMRSAPAMPVITVWRAQVDLLLGRRDSALALHRQGMAVLDDLPENGRWLAALVGLVELAEALADGPGAARLHALLLPAEPFCAAGPSGTVFCSGPVALLLARLALTAGRPEQALAHLEVAREVAGRAGMRPYVVLAHLTTARALEATGDPAGAAQQARVAVATAADLPGPRAAAEDLLRRLGPAGGDPLSPREREVAALIADGLTNREVAERLVLSERTVESHVRNALQRLSLTSRTQLATWVVAHPGGR